MNESEARSQLKEAGLRATSPRVAVLRQLAATDGPLSWAELVEALGEDVECDPATTYRNLLKLTEAGLAEVVGHIDGRDRYALAGDDAHGSHAHPHFVCEDCGQIACLPESTVAELSGKGRWAASVRSAKLQLMGECPDCRKVRRAT